MKRWFGFPTWCAHYTQAAAVRVTGAGAPRTGGGHNVRTHRMSTPRRGTYILDPKP